MQDGGGKREGPIEVYPKIWNLNPIAKDTKEVFFQDPSLDEVFRGYEEGAGDNTGGRHVARRNF